MAAEAILASQESRDPYSIVYHKEDCPESVWEDGNAEVLLDVEEIAGRECEACDYEWGLWDRIIEDSGSAIYGHVAEQMLELDEYVEMFRPHPSEISAYEWAYLRAVRHERTRRQAFQTWQANQQAKVSN